MDTQLADESIWQDQQSVKNLSQQRANLERQTEQFLNLHNDIQELVELVELALAEETEMAALEVMSSCLKDAERIDQQLQNLETQTLFCGDLDHLNCYLEVQAGSGGTEAQDWAQMLLRQYLRWIERHQFQAKILEVSDGEVAGIKSAAVQIIGENAYGWLRNETGVHRLVRKSPFDSGSRRHTSFASIFISPEIDDSFDIELNPADIRVDVYRASGAGGQHVNKTESAVRLTHLPSALVTQCQNSRSQHANKAEAMKQLRAKLYEQEMQQRNKEKQQLEASKADIGWGSQIRSYVLDSGRIKDLRNGMESGDTNGVLDGDLDRFMIASLRLQAYQQA